MKPLKQLSHTESITIAFRVSKEDAEQIQMLCEVSGLIKQDYLRKRALNEEFNIYPNSRVKKLLIKNLEEISLELKAKDNPSPTTWKRLNLLLDIIEKM